MALILENAADAQQESRTQESSCLEASLRSQSSFVTEPRAVRKTGTFIGYLSSFFSSLFPRQATWISVTTFLKLHQAGLMRWRKIYVRACSLVLRELACLTSDQLEVNSLVQCEV